MTVSLAIVLLLLAVDPPDVPVVDAVQTPEVAPPVDVIAPAEPPPPSPTPPPTPTPPPLSAPPPATALDTSTPRAPAVDGAVTEDDVTREQSVDAFSDLEDAQAGVPGVLEVRLRANWGYVPAEGNTPSEELEFSYTPEILPQTEILAAQYFEHDDVDNTSGFLFGWNQRWIKDGGRSSWVPSVGTLTEYFLRTPYIDGLVDFAPGATGGDHIGETLTVAKYLGPGSLYLNGVVERRIFNTQICVDGNDVAYQPSDPRADQSPGLPQQDGCDYWADWALAARVGYKLTVIPEALDIVGDLWIETNEFATQKKSPTYPEPEDHLPYDVAEVAVIWHATDHLTVSPGVQVGLDLRDETPAYEAGLFFLWE